MTEINPDEQTVSEIRDAVGETDDPDTLEAAKTAEMEGDQRVTAISAIDDRLAELNGEADENDEDGAGDDTDELEGDRNGRISVRAAPKHTGHIAGYTFPPGRVRRVPITPAIQKAIRIGHLQVIKR